MALVSYTQPDSGKVQFTMNKNEVLAIPKVMADPIFSSESNWFRVSFVFKHTTSNKRFVPSFKSFSGTKNLRIRSGMAVDDQFELKKIIISKSDRSHLVIKTNEIPSVAGYQFSLSSEGQQTGGGGGESTSQTFATWNPEPNHSLNAEGGVEFIGPYNAWVTSSLEMSGDFEFTYELNSASFANLLPPYSNCQIGVTPKSYKDSGYPFPKFAVGPQGESTNANYGPDSWNYVVNGSVTGTVIGPRGISDKITFKRIGNDLQILINGVLGKTVDVSEFNEPFLPAIGYLTTGQAVLKSYKATSSSNNGGSGGSSYNSIVWTPNTQFYSTSADGGVSAFSDSYGNNNYIRGQKEFSNDFEIAFEVNSATFDMDQSEVSFGICETYNFNVGSAKTSIGFMVYGGGIYGPKKWHAVLKNQYKNESQEISVTGTDILKVKKTGINYKLFVNDTQIYSVTSEYLFTTQGPFVAYCQLKTGNTINKVYELP